LRFTSQSIIHNQSHVYDNVVKRFIMEMGSLLSTAPTTHQIWICNSVCVSMPIFLRAFTSSDKTPTQRCFISSKL